MKRIAGVLARFRKLQQMLGYLANELPNKMMHLEREVDENARSIQQIEQRIAMNGISSSEIIDRIKRDFLENENQAKACMQMLSDMDRRETREFGSLNAYLSYGDFVNPEIMLLHNRQANDGKKHILLIGFYGAYNFRYNNKSVCYMLLFKLMERIRTIKRKRNI